MAEWKKDALKTLLMFVCALLATSEFYRGALFFFSGGFFTFMVTELQDRRRVR